MSGSSALVADAGHSLSDLLSDACTLWALDQARKPATSEHPFGRGKYEAVGASFTAAMIISTGLGIGFHSATSLYEMILNAPPQVDSTTMAIAGATAFAGVLAKEWLYRETMRIGVEIRSPALIANAWHHRSDAWSSLVALGGIGGTLYGLPVLDPIGGVVVAVMVTKIGVEMGLENLSQLTDASVEDELLEQIAKLLADDPDVVATSALRCRRLGPYLHVDSRVQVAFGLTVSAAQQVATKAKLRVLEGMPEVAEVTISLDVEPSLSSKPSFGGAGGTPAPYVTMMRSPAEIEADVRRAISATKFDALWGVSHSHVHWRSREACSGAIVEMNLVLDPSISLHQAHKLASELRESAMRAVPGLIDVDLHAELFDGAAGCHVDLGTISSPDDERLPVGMRLRP